MFKKKPQVKPYAPIRSSDRRKFAQQIIDEFELAPQGTPSEDREAAITALRNSLVPENIQSAKFTTKLGPNLDTVGGVIYAGAHPGETQRPLWIKYNDLFIPTVYTLWHNPKILPVLYTHPPVLEKLYTGADLMIPGLIGPPFAESAKKGKLAAIASSESPTVPLVVGITEIDVAGLTNVVGEKGKAVRTIHWYGDELWNLFGNGGKAPDELNIRELVNDMDNQDGGVSLEGLKIDEVAQRAAQSAGTEPRGEHQVAGEPVDNQDTSSQVVGDATADDKPVDKELTTKEIDDAFRSAVLFGIQHHYTTQQHSSLEFPMSSSTFISTLVLPFLPPASHFHPLGSMSTVHPSLQLKKTSWKNAAKLLKQLDKDEIIKTKTRGGGEVVVMAIDWEDDAVKAFLPYKLPVQSQGASTGSSNSGGGSSSEPTGPLKIIDLYKPVPKISPILEFNKAGTKDLYLASELKSMLAAYLDAETRASPTNKRLVQINPVLADAFPDVEPVNGFVKRDVLAEKFMKVCSPYFVILRPNEEFSRENTKGELKPRPGSTPKITITLEARQGKKTITKVSGLEPYRIDPQALSDELQKLCASSTSVTQLQGSSPKNPVMEVMVQGPQAKAVEKLLEKYGVPGKIIVTVDKTSKKK